MQVSISATRSSSETLYQSIGGEAGLFRLVDVFNNIIETQPAGKLLHILHLRGHGIAHARIELFNFLSGFLGGPSLYVEKYGHSNIRKIHEHVEVTAKARDDWILCMTQALAEVGLPLDIRQRIIQHFSRVATNLINRNT